MKITGVFILFLFSLSSVLGQITDSPELDETILNSKQYLRVQDYSNQRLSPIDNPSVLIQERWLEVQQSMNKATMDPWENFGPDTTSGRIISIAFHPTDPNTFLVGAASGGLWETRDYGSTWQCLTDDFMTMGIGAIAYNPQNPSTILIATGEGYAFGSEFIPGFGCFISYDGGMTWGNTAIVATYDQYFAGMDIYWNPADTSIVNVASSFGMYHSTDGGLNYTYTLDRIGGRMMADPLNPNRVYFTARYYTAAYPGGLYISDDSGLTWTLIDGGLPVPAEFGYSSISIHPTYNNIIYIAVSQSVAVGSGPLEGLYKSSDFGNTFVEIPSSQDIFCYPAPYDDICQGWYDNTILIDEADTSIIYGGGTRMWKSTNGGSDWSTIDYDFSEAKYFLHPDHHQTLYHPLTGDLFDCNDGGVNYSSDNGTTWTSISEGLVTHQFYSIAFAKTNPNIVIAGSQDVGTFTTLNAHGGSWRNDFSGDSFGHIISDEDENTWYGTSYINYQRLKTYDAGGVWSTINAGTSGDQWRMPYAMHPSNSEILLSSDDNFIYRTTNGGGMWTPVSSPGFIGAIEFDQVNPTIIYASQLWGDDIYKSMDGGLTFTLLAATPIPGAPITDLEADPFVMNKLYATVGSFNANEQLFVSPNGGDSWINISNDLPEIPTNTIAISTINPDELYVGNDFGVWVSLNAGLSWEPFIDGLPAAVPVEDIHFYEGDTTVRIGTFGRGYWKTNALSNTYAGEINLNVNDGFKAFPNPSANLFHLSESLQRFEIWNQLGELVFVGSGEVVDLSFYPKGIYYLKAEGVQEKLVKL